jgi:hypothetical protein
MHPGVETPCPKSNIYTSIVTTIAQGTKKQASHMVGKLCVMWSSIYMDGQSHTWWKFFDIRIIKQYHVFFLFLTKKKNLAASERLVIKF